MPEWSSWKFEEGYLLHAFHMVIGFEHAKSQLHAHPLDIPALLSIVLGIGMGLCDIAQQQELEPGAPPPGVPTWFLNSELSVSTHQDALVNCLPLVLPMVPDQVPAIEPEPRRSIRKRKGVKRVDEAIPDPSYVSPYCLAFF